MSSQPFRGFFGYFLLHWRVSVLLMIGVGMAGVFTMLTLPRESTPEVEIPFASVVTVYPGASARDVEELVTDVVENRLESLEGVEEITSSSRLGVSTVSVEFSVEQDITESIRRLREAVDGVTDLPQNAEDPQVIEVSFDSEPIITVALGGISDERLLTVYAQDLADDIATINGISEVRVAGSRTEEVQVLLDPQRVRQAGVSLGQVVGALQAANVNVPLGQVATDGFAYDVRVQGRFTNVSDVAAVTVRTPAGVAVPLDQLGTVRVGLADSTTGARMSIAGQPSTAAITIQVIKKTGGNIIDIVDAVQEQIATARQQDLPPEIVVETFADRAEEIRRSLEDVSRSGLQTFVIVLVILWLFLGWKEALIASSAVPLTFAISFLVFEAAGITLNSISLFSLILALGILVDNAIVMVEGIHRGVGKPQFQEHAMRVVHLFKKPLAGGTLTTVAAFVPMLLVTGIIGDFLRTIPIVLTATLLSSLLVALTCIPVVAYLALRHQKVAATPRRFDTYMQRIQQWYDRRVMWLLEHRRVQNYFIGALIVLLIAGLSLPFIGVLATGLFPEVDIDFMIINVELPPGSVLPQTSAATAKVETILQQQPAIKSYVVNLGASSSLDLGGGSSSENVASIFVNLRENRDITSVMLTRQLRETFREIGEAEVTITEVSAGPPTAAPVELRIIGPDLDRLDELSRTIVDELAAVPGAIDADRNLRLSAGEFTFEFDPSLLATFGLNASDAAFAVRSYLFGSEATSFLGADGEEVSVRVQAPAESIASITDVLTLPLLTSQGQEVRLGQVATVELDTSINTIRRQDGERSVSITAKSDGTRTPNEITAELEERLTQGQLPEDYRLEFGGEQQETEETFTDLYRSMIVAVLLILIILVIEFNSFSQPLLIFLAIPLGLIGVLFGLVILGGQLNFAAFIGLVSLTGIVVNNGIILVDRMNSLTNQGLPLLEAIRRAGNTRLRPVLLTTLTTALGVTPLIWVDEFFRDLALTLVTGLLFSSVLTLAFIPVLYLRLQQRIARRYTRVSEQ